MKERGVITIDIDTARKWYKGEDKYLRALAKQAFTIKELEEPELPTCIEEFYNNYEPKNNYLGKVRLLQTLLMIRDAYRQGWKPDWRCIQNKKWTIMFISDSIKVDFNYDISHLFSFPTENLAQQFLENFRKELEQLKELL